MFPKEEPPPKFMWSLTKRLSPREFWTGLENPSFIRHFADPILLSPVYNKRDQHVLVRWLSDAASQKGAMKDYQARYFKRSVPGGTQTIPVDWDDLRIREYVRSDVVANRLYMFHTLMNAQWNATVGAGKKPEWLKDWERKEAAGAIRRRKR